MRVVNCYSASAFFSAPPGERERVFRGAAPFLLGIGPEETSAAGWLDARSEDLLTCFFSKAWLRIGNAPALLLYGTGSKETESCLRQLSSRVVRQGWPGLHVLSTSGQPDEGYVPAVEDVECSREKTLRAYSDAMRNSGNFIFFRPPSPAQAQVLRASFDRELGEILSGEPSRSMAEEYYALKQKLSFVEDDLARTTEMLENANKFVEVAKHKYKNDYHMLFEFYHREYEVLPLWYKRFGHVVKVFMGKRSLKSLFHDPKTADK
jgi:hypothetical protein